MKKNRDFKKTLGYIFIIIGICFPLVAFSMMTYRELSSNSKYEEFLAEEEKSSPSEKKKVDTFIDDYEEENQNSEQGIIDPFDTENFEGDYPPGIDLNEPFAYLNIPKLNAKKPIYLDATNYHMSIGVAQIAGTSLPVGGIGKRSVIAGHRGWWGDVMFLYVHTLEKGDPIYIERNGDKMTYLVDNFEVIDPSEWEKLLPVKGEDMITLLTCEPFYPPRPYRLLVNCKRLESELATNTGEKETDKKDASQAEDQEQNSTMKKVSLGLYLITLGLIVALVVTLVKFIRYLLGKEK